jgi:hypothetical protein
VQCQPDDAYHHCSTTPSIARSSAGYSPVSLSCLLSQPYMSWSELQESCLCLRHPTKRVAAQLCAVFPTYLTCTYTPAA